MSTHDAYTIIDIVAGIVIAAVGASIVHIVATRARKKFDLEHPPKVERRVVKLEEIPGGKLATLECGHEVRWQMCYPSTCTCDQCAAEIQALKQMAGEK